MRVRIIFTTTAMILAMMGGAFGQSGYWSEPVPVDSINGIINDYYPSISPDGLTLYFATGNGIRFSHWNGQGWGVSEDAGPNINAGQRQIKATVSPDNRTLYFTSWRSGGYGTYDIWRSYWQDSCQCWGQAEVLPPPISTEYMETDVQLSHDGKKMYITSNRSFGWGGLDIWCSIWNDTTQSWMEPTNLGLGLNSDSDDESAYPSIDNRTLYFDSWGTHGFEYPQWMGPVDLFRAHYDGQNWGNIEIMPVPITTGYWETGPSISNDGLTLYFASTRLGGPGLTDIYETHFISAIGEDNDSLNVMSNNLDINIFPNPTNNTVSFKFSPNIVSKPRYLTIFNIQGQQVIKINLADRLSYIWPYNGKNRKEVPSGCYFALYERGELKVSKKFMLLK
jgi:hypothetical protein